MLNEFLATAFDEAGQQMGRRKCNQKCADTIAVGFTENRDSLIVVHLDNILLHFRFLSNVIS